MLILRQYKFLILIFVLGFLSCYLNNKITKPVDSSPQIVHSSLNPNIKLIPNSKAEVIPDIIRSKPSQIPDAEILFLDEKNF